MYFDFRHLREYRNYFVAGLPGCFTLHFKNPKKNIKRETVKRAVAVMIVNRLYGKNHHYLEMVEGIVPEIKNGDQLVDLLSKKLIIRRRLLWQYFQCIKWDISALWCNYFKRHQTQAE